MGRKTNITIALPRREISAGGITTANALPGTNTPENWNLDGSTNQRATGFMPVGGSLTTHQRNHNRVNEITQSVTNNLSPVTFVYEGVPGASNGNLANDGTLIYAYDALNRLIQVNRVSDGLVIATYIYDAMNRRVRKTIFNGGLTGNIPNGATDYLWLGWQVVEERNASNSPVRQYVWGTYPGATALTGASAPTGFRPQVRGYGSLNIDECIQLTTLATLGPQSLPAGAYYLLQDLLYRAVALTNSSGGIVEAYDTDAYGNTIIVTAGYQGNWWADNATQSFYGANEIIYCGYRFDPEVELYYVRNRTYSPGLGRWIQRDPIGYRGGSNPFAYMTKSVVTEADPFGMGFLGEAEAIIAGAFEAILSFGFFIGTRQCYNFVFPTPIAWLELAIVLCAQIEIAGCCQRVRKNVCLIGSFSADGGAYAIGSAKPGWNPPPSSWRSPVSIRQLTRRPFKPGTWLRVPLVHGGQRVGCPPEGPSGAICITLSIGIWTWTFGVRACWAVPGGQFRWKWGMGVGQGIGASVGGAIYATGCARI